ncbi:MAG: hypothetical protein CM15mV92_120 [Caudoviricetes sp.]|nr:MAG: hypothetical protein CM15mV92_120 [Caudoviricetes sp.]
MKCITYAQRNKIWGRINIDLQTLTQWRLLMSDRKFFGLKKKINT